MTNEFAIKEAKEFLYDISYKIGNMATEYLSEKDGIKMREALDVLTQALEQQPSDNCISRDDLGDAISELTYWHFEDGRLIVGGGGSKYETVYKVDDVVRIPNVLPSVTPQPKVGKWIKSSIGGAKICSICQAHMGLSNFKYCPNCGAKMEVEKNE